MPKNSKEKAKEKDLKTTKVAKSTAKSTKAVSSKKTTSSKKVDTKKVSTKSNSKAGKTNVKSTKKTVKSTSKVSKKTLSNSEYYDLPFRYNQTVVKILAQTPNKLFIYWDISDVDRDNLMNQYGDDFFNRSKPILMVTNETMNYTFEVEINDFANSWYLNINDADCKYKIVLGRKLIKEDNSNEYVAIASSNHMDAPNDHILFESLDNRVFFKDTKTNIVNEKELTSIFHIQNVGKIYNVYDIYQKVYKEQVNNDKLNVDLSSS